MTLILNTASWGISSIQLGLNEIASAVTISKFCGSVFTRRENANLFDIFESKFSIDVPELPVWLENIRFSRSCNVLGERMRRIHIPEVMEDVDKFSLSGVATFVVLCTRFVEDQSNIRRLLENLLVGGLGGVVRRTKDKDEDFSYNSSAAGIAYSFKPHIEKFISSCIDSDRDSDQSNRLRQWMAQLAEYGSIGWRTTDPSERRYKASLSLVSEIMGGTSLEDDMARWNGTATLSEWARVHDTLHVTSAYIALSAAANGAAVAVQCMTANGCRYFPGEIPVIEKKSTFLVRLWTCQPPEDVLGILRYSSGNDPTDDSSGQDGKELGDSDTGFVVFGGLLELAICVAQKVDFHPTLEGEPKEILLQVWGTGARIAHRLRWHVHRDGLFFLQWEDQSTLPPQALTLSKILQASDGKLKKISRIVAAAIHDLYRLDDYTRLCDPEGSMEMLPAMEFLVTAIGIESLRKLVYSRDHRLDQYALSLAALAPICGAVRRFTPEAVSESHGISPQSLLWTASTIWGGATLRSQGFSHVDELVLGIVAPHCTVILDMIRDPQAFATSLADGKVFSIWHGAVPMLPRDPQTGFCKSPARALGEPTELRADFKPRNNGGLTGTKVITFEPFLGDPTLSVFCCWYYGNLIAEIQPAKVFKNLLRNHDFHMQKARKGHYTPPENTPPTILITPSALLEITHFDISDNMVAILDEMDHPGWRVYAAGCCPENITYVHHGTRETLDLSQFVKPRGRRVVMIIPGNGES
ncbi:hypothetical protein NA57DRAFT_78210 [Rhizodiscina lignyota]|uniref:Uncharacterized protein n=1 Tax=Rhizodiscina lignyota TaxID=1504668 RepID=A0A9P4IC11_9PEZI|nr:hypothetical protein NA57DRAFT_78210 [Rhizodiscina lignyota]